MENGLHRDTQDIDCDDMSHLIYEVANISKTVKSLLISASIYF